MTRPLFAAALAVLLAPAAVAAQQQRPAPARPARADTAAADTSLRIEYRREVYNYRGGSRDPFRSLAATNAVGPQINDLRVVSIVFDARGGRSVAVVRDVNNPRSYRLRRGDQVGRLRVVQIRQYEVVFQVEEFGFERQETLRLSRPEANR
jgi:opacity protein-like surface antigen